MCSSSLDEALDLLYAQEPMNSKLVAVDTLCSMASVRHARKEIDAAIAAYNKVIAQQKESIRHTPNKNLSLQLAITLGTLADLLVEDSQMAAACNSYAEASDKNREAGLALSHPMQKALKAKISQF
jgi:hypothetical protein